MRIWRYEHGSVLVITVLSLSLLMGFMALGIDVGMLFRAQRQMKIAADAAAVAGALDYKYNNSVSSAVTQGCAAATANGVTGTCTTGECSTSVTSAQVCMMVPPGDGPNAGTSGFVEAIVQDPSPTFFMNLFKVHAVYVSGRAVAGVIGSGSGCILTLAKSGIDISLTGSGVIEATNCNIYDDSTASDAMQLTGSGEITAAAIGIGGGYSSTGSGRISPTPVTGMPPAADPLANLPVPSPNTASNPNGCTATSSSSLCNPSYSGSSNNTLGPGTYTSISNTGSGNLTLTAGNYQIYNNLQETGSGALALGAGNYTIGGSFTSTGSSSVTIASGAGGTDNGTIIVGGSLSLTGSGPLSDNAETFYTEGATTITGSSNLNLVAPTSGTYNGVLIFQSRTDNDAMSLTGSAGSNVEGIVYAPDAPFTLTGSGSWTISLDLIVDTLTETGSGTTDITDYASTVNKSSVLGANYGTVLTAKTAMVE